jgi:hypothetical protein
MKALSDLLYRLAGSTKLRPYESACLDAWRRELSPQAATMLAKQLRLYDFVQRQSADKATGFFCVGDLRCTKFPADVLFPLRTDGTLVAQVVLRRAVSTQQESLRADVFVVDGRLQNITFNKRPRTVFPRDTRSENIEATDVSVLVDPLEADPYTTDPLPGSSGLTGWLLDWAKRWELRDLRKSLPPDLQQRVLQSLDSKPPADYLELIAQTEGAQAGHCTVNGLSKVWSLVWPDDSFYILADIEGRGAVGVRQGDQDGVLYYLGNEEDEAEAAGSSLRAVIEEELMRAESADNAE